MRADVYGKGFQEALGEKARERVPGTAGTMHTDASGGQQGADRSTRDFFLMATENLTCFEASKSRRLFFLSPGSLKPEKTSAGLHALQNLKGEMMVNFVCQLDCTTVLGPWSHIVWAFLCTQFGDEVCI